MARPRLITALLVTLALALGLAACGGDGDGGDAGGSGGDGAEASTPAQPAAAIRRNPRNARVRIIVGSKNFTEQKVLGEIYAQAFAAAGYSVRKRLDLGDEQAAFSALRRGTITGYPEYTGTILLSFLNVPASELPSDEGDAFERARDGMARDGITAFAPTPFTSSNEVGVAKERADELGLQKISDLEGKAKDLTLFGSPECRMRRDCLLGLQQVYGLRFRSFTPVPIDQRHEVLASGRADLSIVFTTDPQIKRNNEVLLEDDKGMFPPYNSTFLMRAADARRAGPDLRRTIEAVNRNLTADVMQELNARVDLDKDTPDEAAKAYLLQFRLVAAS